MSEVVTLYVGNLSYGTTEDALRELFAPWGPVTEVRVMDRGFGFVDLPAENMQAAIDATNGTTFQDRTLTVNQARPRNERGSGGFRSGGGGGGGFRSGGRSGGGRSGGFRDQRRDDRRRY